MDFRVQESECQSVLYEIDLGIRKHVSIDLTGLAWQWYGMPFVCYAAGSGLLRHSTTLLVYDRPHVALWFSLKEEQARC